MILSQDVQSAIGTGQSLTCPFYETIYAEVVSITNFDIDFAVKVDAALTRFCQLGLSKSPGSFLAADSAFLK